MVSSKFKLLNRNKITRNYEIATLSCSSKSFLSTLIWNLVDISILFNFSIFRKISTMNILNVINLVDDGEYLCQTHTNVQEVSQTLPYGAKIAVSVSLLRCLLLKKSLAFLLYLKLFLVLFLVTSPSILIKASWLHGFPWLSLAIHPYQLSLLGSPLDGTRYLHIADD